MRIGAGEVGAILTLLLPAAAFAVAYVLVKVIWKK